MFIEQKIEDLGIILPEVPKKAGIYTQYKPFGEQFIYISGCGPTIDDNKYTGKLGNNLTIEQGQEAARRCILNALSIIKENLGDLDKIKSFIKILAFVASNNDFFQQPLVVNGASQLLIDIFGIEKGLCARSAIGTNVLPGDIPIEIELILELE